MTPRYGEPMRGGRPVRAAQLGVPDPRVDGPPPGAVDNEPAAERSGLAAVETGLRDLDVLDLLLDAPTVPPPASGDPREMPAATPPAEPTVASPAGETENEAREPESEATVAHRSLSPAQLAEQPAGAIPVTGQVHRSGSIPPTGVVDAPPKTPAPAGLQQRPRLDLAQSPAVWFWIWGPLLVAVVLVAFLGGLTMAPVALPAPTVPRPATLTDVSGKVVDTVQPPAPAEQLPADQIPDQMLRAIVAVQDPGYFSRRGLSPGDLVAAGAADLVRVRRHGGTIEERYARQVRVASASRVPSLRESGVAVRLSKQLSRRDLLTRYLNGMYFGNGVYGVGAASRFYFGVPLVRLGTPQIAMLAGIADDPTRNNPLVAPQRAAAAQHDALTSMQLARVLTGAEVAQAGRVRVVAQPHRPLERAPVAPDFAGLVESSLLARYGEDAVYGDALQVATTLDLDLQTALDNTVRRYAGGGTPAVLGLATDPRSGDVRAMVARGIPGGAAEVLFQRRPVGTLAQQLSPAPQGASAPPPGLGDGRSASVGDVASVVGAIAADGVRRDPRELLSVTRPATDDSSAVVLDAADPLPAGAPIMAADAAGNLTAGFRTAARQPGPAGTRVGFALALVDGSDPTGHWTAGCVPALCLTVWFGPPGPAPGAADISGSATNTAADAAAAALGRQIVVGTFTQFLTAAPGRIDVPPLPTPRPTPRTLPSQRSLAPTPRLPARPTAPARRPRPVPTASRSASPVPTASPTPSAQPTPAPSPSVSAGPPVGSGGSGGGGGGGSGHGPEAAPPVTGRR